MNNLFLIIDFDGTVAQTDVTDEVLSRFADAEWRDIEDIWLKGRIGSRECLARQMALVDASADTLLEFVDTLAIDRHFRSFVQFVHLHRIPAAIVSDGFSLFIERLVGNAGIAGIPVFANRLTRQNGVWRAVFPHSREACRSGTCKCAVADALAGKTPVMLIGDGRSDYCLAAKADFVLAKGNLATYCRTRGITHTEFSDFGDIIRQLQLLTENARSVG